MQITNQPTLSFSMVAQLPNEVTGNVRLAFAYHAGRAVSCLHYRNSLHLY